MPGATRRRIVPGVISGEGTLTASVAIITGAGRVTSSIPADAASLLASARRHAARGMRARATDEHDDAALQLGIMLEHIAKAYLASLHPTLLLEARFDLLSLLRLAGQGHRINTAHSIKTVGLQVALERVGTIEAGGNTGAGVSFARRFDVVLQARNGVAHIGDHGDFADEVAQLAVRGADEILSMMGHSLTDVFSTDYRDAAVALLNEHSTAVEQVVTLRLGHARQALADRSSGLSDAEREDELGAIDRLTLVTAEEQDKRVALGCPACERIGLLGGSPYLELEPGARFVDEDGKEKVVVAIKVQLSADAFRCPVCGLRLHGQEQLQEAGLPTQALVRIGSHEDFAAFADDLRFADESNDEGDQGT